MQKLRKILSYLKKHWEYIFGIVTFVVISQMSLQLLLKFALATTEIQAAFYALMFSLAPAFFFTYLVSHKFRDYSHEHLKAITLISLLLTLVTFSLQSELSILQSTFEAEDALKQSNNYNYELIQSIEKSTASSATEAWWMDFQYDSYEKNFQYISKNYPFECLNAYGNMIYEARAINNLNRQREEIELSETQYATTSFQFKNLEALGQQYLNKQFLLASLTKSNLIKAVGECQDGKQRKY